ncbi:MAG: ABC transporter substrate-binding protein [Deltaproteobacteria bacterium]|nr:ABC transporter substrate-binding protein [Deltaproteobacteria bacterium]
MESARLRAIAFKIGVTMTQKFKILVVAILATLSVAALAVAQTPGEQVRETIKRVTGIVGASAAGESERRDALKRLILPRFDWNEMARLALGKHWPATPARQHEFVVTFTEFIGNAYLGQIGAYHDEKILYLGERRENNRAQVDTKLQPASGDPLTVNYMLHHVEGEWKIYDVVIADISLVNNYRAQFNRILTKGSLEDLLRQLKEKESKDRG